tara:strand:+ start:110 stop:472 length:363 start_codon:yes stop_codon:yes gene_type:complete
MNKFLMILMASMLLTSTAIAADNIDFPKIDLSAVTDTAYNTKTEVATTEFGIVAETLGFAVSALPTWNFDTSDFSNIELALSYDIEVADSFKLSPYGEVNYNNDLDRGDTVIGIKSEYKF